MTLSHPKTTPKLSKVRLRAWLKILKTSNLIEKTLRERLRDDCATTLPRFDVLSALWVFIWNSDATVLPYLS